MPGKYEGNENPKQAELLDRITLDGWGNESTGSVDEDGFHATLVVIEPDEREEVARAFEDEAKELGTEVPVGYFVVVTDENGFVQVTGYDANSQARKAFGEYVMRASKTE